MAAPFSEFVGNRRLLWIAQEWDKNSDQLAEWAMEHLVNRRDVWGQYTMKEGEVGFVTLPIPERRGTGSDMVTMQKLRRHFSGRAVSHLISLHSISDHNTCKWFAVDIDLHDPNVVNADEIAAANLAAALEWARRLREQLFDPCVIDTNGRGGYHLLTLLDHEYPLADVYDYVNELRSDWDKFGLPRKPECFPPRREVAEGHLPYPLRVPGRHHTFPHYSRVWNFDAVGENEWLEGAEAIEALIALRPAELKVAPSVRKTARTLVKKKKEAKRKPRVCVDLDGVLAKYESWRGPDQIGPPLPGASRIRYVAFADRRHRYLYHPLLARALRRTLNDDTGFAGPVEDTDHRLAGKIQLPLRRCLRRPGKTPRPRLHRRPRRQLQPPKRPRRLRQSPRRGKRSRESPVGKTTSDGHGRETTSQR